VDVIHSFLFKPGINTIYYKFKQDQAEISIFICPLYSDAGAYSNRSKRL